MHQAELDYFKDPVIQTEITTDVRKSKTVEHQEKIPGGSLMLDIYKFSFDR
jgi:hypothetical protein